MLQDSGVSNNHNYLHNTTHQVLKSMNCFKKIIIMLCGSFHSMILNIIKQKYIIFSLKFTVHSISRPPINN